MSRLKVVAAMLCVFPWALLASGLHAQAGSAPYQQSFVVHHGPIASMMSSSTRPAAVHRSHRAENSMEAMQATSKASAPSAAANGTIPNGTMSGPLAMFGKTSESNTPWSIVLGLTLLTLVPAILLAMTPMVRLLVVFHFLRQALGTQTAPSNQVLMGLALMMTWFLLQPVLAAVDKTAVTPYRNGEITASEALDRGSVPVKLYMLHYAREKDLAIFANAAMHTRPASPADLPMPVVVPAYILSELKAGFQIGAVLFLPFLLIDFLVSSVTTSIGMLQLSPIVISTPVKILLFVMVDGWSLLADQLIKSF